MNKELLKRILSAMNGSGPGAHLRDLKRDIESELAKPEPVPEPEPVAWTMSYNGMVEHGAYIRIMSKEELEEETRLAGCTARLIPLYTFPPSKPEPEKFEIEWPEYHCQGMGCGLEDSGITDRYEAMKYGWDCAMEAVSESIPDELYVAS